MGLSAPQELKGALQLDLERVQSIRRAGSRPQTGRSLTRVSASLSRSFQFYEQGNLYTSYNYSLAYRCDAQSTVSGTGLSLLWCPSDTEIAGVVYTEQPRWRHTFPWPVTFTSTRAITASGPARSRAIRHRPRVSSPPWSPGLAVFARPRQDLYR